MKENEENEREWSGAFNAPENEEKKPPRGEAWRGEEDGIVSLTTDVAILQS